LDLGSTKLSHPALAELTEAQRHQAMACGMLGVFVTLRGIFGSDAAIGVITTASFAFGSVLGLSTTDVLVVVTVAVVVVLYYRQLLFTTFDPEVAEVSGVNVRRIDALLMLLLSFARMLWLSSLIGGLCGLGGCT
jgi:ABC-type Mn2+/Zn2+ transport system permease subunit